MRCLPPAACCCLAAGFLASAAVAFFGASKNEERVRTARGEGRPDRVCCMLTVRLFAKQSAMHPPLGSPIGSLYDGFETA